LILSVGRLHPQKHHEVLIKAAAGWRDRAPQPVAVIVGTGPAYLPLAGLISVSRAPVLLLGQRDDVADLLAAADVAVVTSRWEARQLFAQEALQAGVPLVATAVGGIPELVGDAAVLVAPDDPAAVRAAVLDLLDDPHDRARLAAAGPARAATWPSAQECFDLVSGVYDELISASRATPAADDLADAGSRGPTAGDGAGDDHDRLGR
jgi:glycosyltransferase involved in cell wall biosynthesis